MATKDKFDWFCREWGAVMKVGSKTKRLIQIGLLIVILVLVGFLQRQYRQDSASLELARKLREKLELRCRETKQLPSSEEFKELLKETAKTSLEHQRWRYRVDESQKEVTLNYPMRLPVLWAPGRAIKSRKLPLIESFRLDLKCGQDGLSEQ